MERPTLWGMMLLVCWVVGSTIIGRSFIALAPDPSDTQLFAYFGLQWLHGHIPYVDIWDNKPPGIFAVNALVFLLFPKNFTAVAGLQGLFILSCTGTIYFLMRQWGGPWLVASLATASVAVATNLFYYHQGCNLAEIYMLWPVVLSMYFFSKASPTFQGKWILLAGFFSGMALLFKPTGLSPLLAQGTFVFLLWAVFRRLSMRQLLASGFVNSAGALVAWIPFAIYFWRHNALRELVDASLIYNVHYGVASYGIIPLAPFNAVSNLLSLASLVVCVLVGGILYMELCMTARHSRAPAGRSRQALCFWWPLALLWVVFDLAGALAGGRGYTQYFIPLAASLSVAAGFTYWFLIDGISDEARRSGFDKAIFALIIGPLLLPQMLDVRQLTRWVLFPSERHTWAQSREAVATYLNMVRGPSDTLFTWDYFPSLYFTTDMDNPTRILDAHYIFDSEYSHRKFGEEILQGLTRAPPSFIVDGWNSASDASFRSEDPVYKKFHEFLEHNYVEIYTVENLRVYKRQTPGRVVGE